MSGYGEAALPPYLEESPTSVIIFFEKARKILEQQTLPFSLEEFHTVLDNLAAGNTAAKAALDMALHDLLARSLNKPVYALLGLEKPQPKDTSVTISIGDLNLIPKKIEELKDFSLLKVKLGSGNDKEIITRIRQNTNKPLVIDVNQGWDDKHFGLDMINWLHEQNVLYAEQPLGKTKLEDTRWITERSPMPILADESMQRLSDLGKIAGCFSGINLKLMKCAGLYEALKIIQAAKENKLKINIGCMSESSCGIAAAAQLMGLVDWIDLDGPMLIRNDPFDGTSFKDGKLVLAGAAGLGVQEKNNLNFQ